MSRARWFVPLLVTVLFAVGCGKKGGVTEPTTDPTGAQTLVSQANTRLGEIIAAQVSEPNAPSDLDFREPYDLYGQALAKDPANRDARFGQAVLGMMIMTSDPEVNAAFAEWAAYLPDHLPFEAPSGPSPFGVPTRLGRGRDVLHLPFERFAVSQAAMTRAALVPADPQIGRIQDILEQRALPKLATAMSNLAMVAADPGWTFIVTPAMQGDPGADPIEIDRTDVLALRAACGLLASIIDQAVAYDLNFAAYDSAGLVNAFKRGSGWLAFRDNGAARMSHARTAVLGAVDDAEASLASLLAETDAQDDDAIKTDPQFTPADQESLRAYFGYVRTGMGSGFRVPGDWDHDPGTPNTNLEIRPAALFDNPPPDWKELLPAYTVTAVRQPFGLNYFWEEDTLWTSGTFPVSGYSYGSYSLSIDSGGSYTWSGGDSYLLSTLAYLADSIETHVTSLPGWGGNLYVSLYYSSYFPAGTSGVGIHYYVSYSLASTAVFVPQITWNAATFAAWTWPDPTFRGLLPGITTTAQLMTLWGMTAADWQRTVTLDWKGARLAPVRGPMSASRR